MGKNEKGTLGRALVKHHNHMVQREKEKSLLYKSQRNKVLESITDVSNIDAVIQQAEEAESLFLAEHPVSTIPIDLSGGIERNGSTSEERRELQRKEEALHTSSIRVPRRPPWNAETSAEQLDTNERQSFLIWRRSLAKLEENEKLVLTPFEKNLDIWRQLWRVVERSELLVTVVDARNPLFYRCPDLEAYVKEVDEHKRTMLLINKADLLPYSVRVKWAKYFHDRGILFLFWSAKSASAALEGKKIPVSTETPNASQELENIDVKVYGRDELLVRLQAEAEDIALMREKSKFHSNIDTSTAHSYSHSYVREKNNVGQPSIKGVTVGFVGYPNVGKSSTINALVGEKRTGVTSTPGKTKHFQTIVISEKLILCDCPGLVFPSFTSSRYEMIACGVLPIDRMTSHREALQVVANRVPRLAIERVYKITLPKPKPYEPKSRPPLASELLRAYCASRGYVGSAGLPDETKAARIILKDYVDGKLPHFELPPGSEKEEEYELVENDGEEESDSCDEVGSSSVGGEEGEGSTVVNEELLNDLNSFDIGSSLETKKGKAKKVAPVAPHKHHHKKPQRKKDRSWRVGNDDGDGMPVVRVFQKPVNTGPVKI